MSTVRIQIRRGLATDWHDINPVLGAGEMGYETDSNQFKFGDAVTHWNDLPYAGLNDVNLNELVQDTVSSTLVAGNGISVTYRDVDGKIDLANTGVLSFNTRTGSITLTDTDVNTALGYTAADAADLIDLGNQTSSDIADAITTAENYADSLAVNYDAAGAAAAAETAAKNYADGLASNYDAAGAATTALNHTQTD
jgi:hypothetical protein